jgi:hypothetical protein
MIIKVGFEALETAMVTVSSIVSDKLLTDDLKNVIIWVKDGKTRFAAYNGNISSATEVVTEVVFDGEPVETFVQLKAKDINDVVASLKGLKRTKVSRVEFDIKENEAVMHVFEEAISAEQENALKYTQESRFRIIKPRLKDVVKNSIKEINIEVEGIQIPSVDLLLYINALYPTVAKETRESTNNVLFGTEHIYSVLAPYSAIMKNKLPEVISGFRLSNSVVNFLKNFITNAETFSIDKQDMGNGMVILTVKANESVAVIRCADMQRSFDMTNMITIPPNGVVIDKVYLIDVLKRMNLDSEAAHVEIIIENGLGSMKVTGKKYTQNIPVVKTKGEGSFTFTIRAELLSNVIFSHTSIFGELVYIYLEHGDRGNIIMSCLDNSELWQTKVTGLASSKGDFSWS